MPEAEKPSADSYRMLVEREWADLHHSRVQEWTALGVVTGAHVGLLQLFAFVHDKALPVAFSTLALLGGALAAAFAVFGLLMTLRHRQLMSVKLGWIYAAEEQLGLIKTDTNTQGIIPEHAEMKRTIQWKGLGIPRAFSTSWLLACFYVLFLIVDTVAVVLVLLS